MKTVVKFILPSLDLIINSIVFYKVLMNFLSYLEFEFLISCMFFLFFIIVSINTIFKNAIPFLAQQRNFNMLFIAQFVSSILIFQLMGWIFSVYLTFVFMLTYLYFTKQHNFFMGFMHLCGITTGGIFLYTLFF